MAYSGLQAALMIARTRKLLSLLVMINACSSEPLQSGEGGAGASGSAGAGSTGAPPPGNFPELSYAAYPDGPYGYGVGATIANLSFMGWRDPVKSNYDVNQFDNVSLAEFYNPSGAQDKPRLLLINASAVWCVVCRAEYSQLRRDKTYDTFKPKGVEVLGVLFEDNDHNPARPSDLQQWGGDKGFNVKFPLVLDPGFKISKYFTSDATPMNLLIDTTSMRIINITMGYDPTNPDDYWDKIAIELAK